MSSHLLIFRTDQFIMSYTSLPVVWSFHFTTATEAPDCKKDTITNKSLCTLLIYDLLRSKSIGYFQNTTKIITILNCRVWREGWAGSGWGGVMGWGRTSGVGSNELSAKEDSSLVLTLMIPRVNQSTAVIYIQLRRGAAGSRQRLLVWWGLS